MKLEDKENVEGVKCKDFPISRIDKYENITILQMRRLMYENNGIGLAGPQVGINRDFFIMRYGNEIISCYNPSWTPKISKKAISKEGCLTYMPTWLNQKNILRYKLINTEFINSEGVLVKIKMRGTDAIVFQHECDHLIGKTIFYNPEEKS